MKSVIRHYLVLLLLITPFSYAFADEYKDTIDLFKMAGASNAFFGENYGYAVFPTIGKGGIGIGGAYGDGRVYKGGKYVGDTDMYQLSLGLQLGGQAFSQIIFFQDARAFEQFTGGSFEFGAQASAVAVTAAASATASTSGVSAGTSAGNKDADTVGNKYYRGMAIFTIATGGLMYEASVAGQTFTYSPRK